MLSLELGLLSVFLFLISGPWLGREVPSKAQEVRVQLDSRPEV